MLQPRYLIICSLQDINLIRAQYWVATTHKRSLYMQPIPASIKPGISPQELGIVRSNRDWPPTPSNYPTKKLKRPAGPLLHILLLRYR